jgi:VCBS repeat-containing protein
MEAAVMPTFDNTPRGTVVSIWGKAYIRGMDGVWRPLKLGEVVKPGDALLTEQNAIVQMSDGKSEPAIVARPSADIERAITALEQGERDAAPAAGLAGGDGGDLQPGLRVDRIVESVTAAGPVTRLDGVSITSGIATQSDPAGAGSAAGVGAPSSAIGAFEEGVPVGLGLGLPTGSGTLVVTVTQVPAIGQVVRADGSPVAAGSVLAPADLPGLVYLPPADYDGVAPVGGLQFTVSNGSSNASGSTQITLTAVNDAPLATAASAGGDEDTLIGLALGGTDVDGAIASVQVVTLPSNGTLLLADGVTAVLAGQALTPAQATGLLFRPDPDFHGSTGLAFTVTDNGGLVSSPTTVAIAVTPVNDAPVAADDAVSTVGTVPVSVAVLANDVDVDIDTLRVTGATVDAALGSVVINAAGSLGFTAAPGVSGPVLITYTVADPSGATDTATLTVNVAAAPTVTVDAPALSNDSTPVIAGTSNLAPGSTVTLTVTDANGSSQTFTATVQPDGSYSASVPAPLAEGAYTVGAAVSVGAASASASDGGSIDTTAPTVTVDAPALGNDATPTITGTTDLPAGSIVSLTVTGANGGVQSFTATVQAGGSFSADVPAALVDGGYSVVALGTDAAGNTGSASDSGVIDTTPPALAVDAPALTNDATPTITGSTDLPTGSLVTLTVTGANGAVQSFAATVQPGGSFSADVPAALAEGGFSVSASASDTAGNIANASDSGMLDLTGPALTVDAPALTNDSTPTISGTTDLPAGSVVLLSVTGANGAVQTFSATVQAGGSYSAAVPAALVEGGYSVTASATDAAGNGTSASDSGVLDLTAPTITVDAPALGNDATPTITGTTDLPAGSTVALTVTGANGAVQNFTATVQAGGSYSADVPAALVEGAYSVVATATDAAGNSANANDSGAVDLTLPVITVDAPALTNDSTPTITGSTDLPAGATVTLAVTGANGAVQNFSATVQAGGVFSADVPAALAEGGYGVVASATDAAGNSASANDSGVIDLTLPTISVDAPALGNDATPTITGTTDLPAGSVVLLSVTGSNGAVQSFTATVQAGGSYSADVPAALVEGPYAVTATATDAAGNSASANDSGVLDLTAPAITVDAPALTNDSTPTITGTTNLPVGATVALAVTGADGAVQNFSATVQAGGVYSADVPGALAEGGYSVVATAVDAAGNSASASDNGTLDVTPPLITVDAPALTNDTTPTITGSTNLPAGSIVTLGVVDGTGVLRTFFAVVQAGGSYSADVPSALVAGGYGVAAGVTDAAGNSATATDTGVIDLTAPTLTVNAPALTNDSTPTITGTTDLPAGATVTLTVTGANGAVQFFAATVQAGGSYSADVPSALVEGGYTVVAGVTDGAGNSASASDSGAIDLTPPAASIAVDAVTADNIVNAGEAGGTVTLTGTVGGDVQPGDTVTLTANGNSYSGLVQAGNTFAIAVAGSDLLADADRRIDASVTTTDAAGNSRTATATHDYAVNTAPVAVADALSIGEDTASAAGDVTPGSVGQDSDADGDPLTVTGVAAGALPSASGNVGSAVTGSWGTLTLNADGSYSYAPAAAAQSLDAGQTVSDTFTYTIADGRGGSATATLTVSVVGADDPTTIAGAFSGSVQEDAVATASGALSATDPDVGSRAFVAQSGTPGSYGSFSIDAAGNWSYSLANAAANVQALAAGQSVTETFVVAADDGTTASITVTVSGSNDAPVVSSTAISAVEQGAAVSLGLALPSDVDAGALLAINVTGLPAIGQVQLADGTPLANGATLTPAQLAGLRYLPPADYDGVAPVGGFSYSVSDGLAATSGGTSITLTAVNDAPTLSGLAGSITYTEAGTTSVTRTLIDTSVVFGDVDSPNLAGGSLTVRITNVVAGEDLLDVRSQGTADGQISVVGTDVRYNPVGAGGVVSIGTLSGGTGGAPLVISFNANATPAAVDALIQNVRYGNQSQQPTTTPRNVSFTIVDGDGTANGGADTVSASVTINVVRSNDAPSFAGLGGTRTYVENGTPVVLDSNATLNDPELGTGFVGSANNLGGAVLTLARSGGANAQDQFSGGGTLSLAGGNVVLGGVTVGTYSPAALASGTLAITFADGVTRTQANTVLQQIRYANASDAPPASVIVGFALSDGNSGGQGSPATPRTAAGSVTVNITPVNDAPVAGSGSAGTSENASFSASVPAATDVDGTVASYALVSGVGTGNGTLAFNADGSYSFDPGSDFDSLAAGATRQVSFTYTATDNNGAVSAPAMVTITVTGTNDGPVAVDDGSAGTPALTVAEDSGPSAPIAVLANDSDVDGDTLTVTAASSPNGAVTINPDNTLVFTPAANFNGPTTITYTVSDGQGGSASATVFVSVTAVNDAPVAADDALSTSEDTPLTIPAATLLANDTDVDGQPLFVVAVYSPVNGTVALVGGDVLFTPAPDYIGPASFTYMVTDAFGGISTATAHITVGPVNDAPVAQPASFTVAEDSSLVSGAVIASDADAGAVLSFALDGAPPAGLVFNADGSYSFDPSVAAYQSLGVGQSQVLTVPYTVTDEAGASSGASLVITVTGTNDAPVAAAASFAVSEDAAVVNGNVAASDVDANAVLGFALNGAAPAGLVFNADGSYSFDASNAAYQSLAAGQVQVLTVPYTVTDQHGANSSANLVITVTGVNDAAVVTGVAAGSVAEDGTLLATGTLAATDVDSPTSFTAASVSGSYGNFSIDAAGQWTYTLRNGDANVQALTSSQQPTETFNVTTADGTVQQITVTVNGSNEAPVATVAPASGAEDAAGIPVTLGGSDVDGSVASFTVTSLPANGTLLYGGVPVTLGAAIPASAGSATLGFVPAANWNGSTSIGFTATDNEGATSPVVSQSITVSAVNDAPVASDDSTSTPINTPLASIPVLANDGDVDGDALTVVAATLANPALGSVSINPDGTLAFSPALNVTGPVLVNYTVRDPSGATSSATLTVSVGTNTAPTGADTTLTLAEDGSRTFAPADFGFADADAGQTLAAVRIDTLPGAGSLTFNGMPVMAGQLIPAGDLADLVFTPASNANGNAYASFSFSVQDNAGGFDTTSNTVTLNVTPVNDAPVAAAESFTTGEDQPLTIPLASLLANDSDIDLDPLTVVSVQGAVQGTVAIVGSDVVFTPDADYHGPASFTYTISDGQGGSATATVSITVNPVNDAAVIGGDDAGAVTEDVAVVTGTLSDSGTLTISDVDAGEAAFVAGAGTPVGANLGALTIAADGTWTYEVANADVQYLAAGQTRSESFTVRSIDGTTHTVTVTITGTNDGPVASGSSFAVAEDAAVVNGSVSATDVDAGAVLSYALTGAAPAGLTFNTDGTYSFDPGHAAYQSLGVGQSTVVTVPFRATDDQGANSIANLVITVTGTNDAPVAVADTGAANENASLTTTAATGVLANDTDIDGGDSRSVSAVSFGATSGTVGAALVGTYGTLTLNADGSYAYAATTPAADALAAGQIVTESFTYTMHDAAGATSTATITFTVTGTDDAPTITGPLAGSVTEDTTLSSTGTLTVVDADAGQSTWVAQAGSAGTYGSFSINAAGAWTYTLNSAAANVQSLPAGASVTDSFTVVTTDGTTRTVVITVNGTNDGPVAVGSSLSVAEDATLVNGSVTATDVDTGAMLSYALTGAAPAGLAFNADGSYSFDPTDAAYQSLGVGQSTVITVPFQAIDDQGASSVANLVITVTGTNDGPMAVADSGSLNENATLTTTAATGVLSNDTDVDAGDSRAVSAVSFGATAGSVGVALNGTYGTLTLNADGSYSYAANQPASEALTAGQIVTEPFSYTMRDAAGATSTATVTFTVTGTDDAPTITGPLAGSVTEDATLSTGGTLTITDPDAGQSSFVAQSGTAGAYGSFSISAAGVWSYSLDNAAANVQSLPAGASVTDSFAVTTADGTTRTIVVTVNGSNDGPVAVGSTFTVAEDAAVVNGVVNATDADTGAVLSYALTGAAPAGLTFNADGSYSFDPTVAAYQSLGVSQSTVLTIPFTATDAQGASSTANLVITVTGTNDGPVAVADAGAVAENATLTVGAAGGVLANDTDADSGDTKTVSAVSFGATTGTVGTALNGTYGTLTLNADGSYSYAANQPAVEALTAGQVVTESFSYTMRDAAGAASTSTITFTVTGTDDVPIITGPLAGTVTEDGTLTSTGTLVVTDPDAGQSSFVVQSGTTGTYGSFSINAAGAWTYTLNNAAAHVQALPAGATATDSFTVTTADGTTRNIVITVNGTNDGPVAVGSSFSVAEDAAVVNGAVSATDVDMGAVLSYALTGAAPAGLTFNTDGSYSFNPTHAAYQSLGVGQSTVITVPFRATDAQGAISTANLVITVTGTNDGPTAVADAGSLNENATLTTTAATGVLSNDTDVDAGDTRTVSAVSFGATTGTVGSALDGTYGTLTLNADGSYSYSANRPAAEALAAGQTVTESFSYTMRDAAGATSTATITFTVTGTNDLPTITGPLAGAVTEDGTLTSTGTLVVADPDAGQSSFVVQSGSAGTYGSFSITAAEVWSYALNNAAANVQSLPAGASVTDSFTVTTADGTTRTVVITVNGTNDGPVAIGSSVTVAEDATVVDGAVSATDVDTGAVLSYALTGAAPAGLSFNADGSYSFNPGHAAYQSLGVGQSTVITVPFRATDAQGASSVANLVITVTGTNDGPAAVADTGAVNENATLTVSAAAGVLSNDTDVDAGDSRTVSAVSFGATTGTVGSALNGTYGTLTLNADGSYLYAANRPAVEALAAGQIVTESFSYTMRDAAGATSTATITFTVTGTNDAPTITGPLTGAVTEDGTLTSSGTLVVSDPDAGQSSFVVQSGAAGTYGSFSITAAGAWTYTLNNAAANVQALPTGASVTDSFTVTTADGTTRTVVVTVNGTNDGPVAVGSSFTVAEDAAVVNGAVSATDVDTGAVLSYALTGAAPAGLAFNSNGTYSFNPAHAAYQSLRVGQSTVLTIPFTATDAQGASSTANLVITVTGTNDAPVAVADVVTAVEAGGVANGTAGSNPSGNVLTNDTDVDSGDTRTVSAVSGSAAGTVGGSTAGSYGSLTLNADGSYSYAVNNGLAAVQALRTTANTLTDTFTYTVRDANGATSSTTLTVTIQGANDAPVATVDTGAVNENATLTATAAAGVLANDTDVDAGDTRTVSAVSFGATSGTVGSALNGTYGTLTLNADGSYSYSANRPSVEALAPGQTVTESFSYTMRDTAGATSTATITFTVTGTNDAPVITSNGAGTTAAVSVAENSTAVTTVTATDVDAGQTLSYSIVGGADAARFTINPTTGALAFASAPDFEAPTDANGDNVYVVQVQVADGAGGTDLQTISVTVTNVNEAPTAANASVSTNEDVVLNGSLPAATDPDGNLVTYSLASAASNGTVVVNANGTYAYTPAAHYSGSDSFSYTVSDGAGGSNTYTVAVNVAAVADAPSLSMPSLIASVVQGGQTINTEPGITQANLEATFGLTSGVLDTFDPPPGSGTSDAGTVDVIDGKGAQYNLSLGTGNTASFAWQFFNGEDTVSEINGGYNDLVVLVVTDPSGARQYVQVTSSEQTGRNTNGTAADATGTYNFTATTAGEYSFSWLVLNGRDGGKDSSLAIGAPTVTIGGTTYGLPIGFAIPAGLVDRDGSESLAVTVSGLPTGAAFSAGTSLGGGVWSFTPAQLVGLQLLPAAGYTGTMNLNVTATSTEASSGATASTTQSVQVNVTATSSSITGSQNADTSSGTGADETLQGFGGNDNLSGGAGNDLLYGGDGNDTLDGGNGHDVLYGGAGNDSLTGGAGNDRLIGGLGSDSLTGGAGADTFEWRFADRGTAGSPAIDTVADFDSATPGAGGDILDLRDLLQGETSSATLDRYLDFSVSGGTTTIRISSSGGFASGTYAAGSEDQRIVLTGVDIRATLGLPVAATDAQIISELINRGKLLTDVPPGS